LIKRSILAFALVGMFAVPVLADPFSDGVMAHLKRDYATAMRLWRPLAEQGNAMVQHSVGEMYARGQGVPRDYVQAHMWFSLSAAQGHEIAQTRRDSVAKLMTPAQLAKARRLTRERKTK
jgi:hypothetical protein